HGVEQLNNLPAGTRIEVLGEDFDGGSDAFVDTAAVMESLDLIITSDTAVAHLAGALRRPAWVALRYVPDWRWLLDREDTPWYPTLRLFRQQTLGDWKGVFLRIANELRSRPRISERHVPLIGSDTNSFDPASAGQEAIALHQAGKLEKAERLYRKILVSE